MTYLQRIGALDVAETIAERIGSYVDMNFLQFLAVEGDRARCWYMNSSGDGPRVGIELHRTLDGWQMTLEEHPPGTE
jgi:hypothetical protein